MGFLVMSMPRLLLLAASGLLLCSFVESRGNDAVDLRDVASLTFMRGKTTAGRRTAGVPQLQCTGGDACSSAHLVDVVQCHNTGENDMGEVQWKCETDLDDSLRLGELNVNCEGYTSRHDRLKLRGSCGLQYSLYYTSKGKQRKADTDFRSGVNSYGSKHHRTTSSVASYGGDSGSWASSILLAGMVLLLVVVCMREHRGRTSSSSHSASASGNPPNGSSYERPPPYNPNAGYAQAPPAPPPYNAAPGSSSGWSNPAAGFAPPGGFWGGAALGGLLGSMFGARRNHGYANGWGNGYGMGGGGGWGGGGWGGFRRPTRPTTTGFAYAMGGNNSGYSNSNQGYSSSSSSSSESNKRKATGYGGSSTR